MDKHLKDIQELGQTIKVTPPEGAWQRIENRLADNKSRQKKNKLKVVKYWLSIAASLTVIFTCGFLIYNETQPSPLVMDGYISEWEELSTGEDYFYNVESVRQSHAIHYPALGKDS